MADEIMLELTADIVASHLTNNKVAVGDVAELIRNVHATLTSLGQPAAEPVAELKPAVPIRSSIKPDYLVSLESGKKMKMLKRYLQTNYGMSPDDYRKKWGLAADYPMVAPNYAETRRNLAVKSGLGRKKEVAPPPPKARKPRKTTPKA
ncbi:Ros/MucR family transcriptional regulator [Rhizorhabdus wittichii]|jgi:predicted transcriptional regulator|uniref:Transcriptional regulator, MucR family n=2 Tax=Rhizorhabdus wittichii TaxID=160791 RepID=A0A9J9LDX0_RHIWR|nr:MucR family transcriptional regulator [Rhizorhabdus wittichii]ABQ68163.1 transcriptional regulator, MucR family [Rhizorhabdus wittichii RW1]ARR54938.1 transcriptional regulator [Rhizorhabdus wittichii DC-6]QTH24677.1 MucR family transcriptional regulator [Rhizorhabdus wittichii]